ncbi:MAG: MBL fold metallo-hydrolase [Sulfolobales archaeon]
MSSSIKIQWYGHACIGVHAYGKTLIIDPHDGGSIGIKRPEVKADYVLITHDHFDHNAHRVVSRDDTKIFKMKEGDFEIPPFRVRGVKTYHDKEGGRRRGSNIVYVIRTSGGVSILHAGDLGHIPDESTMKKFERVDIAILPIGGVFTIDYVEALEVFQLLRARIMIPIHYWVKGVNIPLAPVENLVKEAEKKGFKIESLDTNYLEVEDSPERLGEIRITVLKYL